jgi:hypothetical protein
VSATTSVAGDLCPICASTTCKVCTRCPLRYCQHHPCPVCGQALEHADLHPAAVTTDEEWAGRARMAACKLDAGLPMTDVEAEALRRCPNPEFLCRTCRAYRPRGHVCVPPPDAWTTCGRCGRYLEEPSRPCPLCTDAVRRWSVNTVEAQRARREASRRTAELTAAVAEAAAAPSGAPGMGGGSRPTRTAQLSASTPNPRRTP